MSVAIYPRIMLFCQRANATLIGGTHQGEHVIAKMAIPDLDGTLEEGFEIVFRGRDASSVDQKMLDIIEPKGPVAA